MWNVPNFSKTSWANKICLQQLKMPGLKSQEMTGTFLYALTKPWLLPYRGGLWCRARYRGVVYPLSIPAGPESIQPLHLCLVHTSCQEALCAPLEMQVEQEVTRRDFLYNFGEICLWLCQWGSSLPISWSNHRRPWSPHTCSLIHSSFIHSLTGIYRILDTVVSVSLWGWWLWSLPWLCLPFIWWYLDGVSVSEVKVPVPAYLFYKAPAEIEGALSLSASMETSSPRASLTQNVSNLFLLIWYVG